MTTLLASTRPEQLWFFDTTVSFVVSHDEGADGISVLRSRARRGDSPPLHVHATEDEAFHVVDGRLRLTLDGVIRSIGPGETLFLPKGVAHTYVVDTPEATWLAITTNGDFERFVRAVACPAEEDGLPPAHVPTDEEHERVVAAARASGIEFVGPPLT